jgi:tetratricopeptide (TPR) repeat protein
MTHPSEPVTTSGTIAVVNLSAQIDGLAMRVLRAASEPAQWLILIDLLTLRGHVLGRIADYEQAAELAEQLVRDTADDGTALLARARTRATFHRFTEALADLDAAERSGLETPALQAERAVILQAAGRYAQAEELYRSAEKYQPDFSVLEHRPYFSALAALAVLHAERGEVAEAERLFAEARHRFQGISPFPVASLDFRRGLMWSGRGNLLAARAWFHASQRRVPAYAPALGHLAEIDSALGAHQAAIDRLRPWPPPATTLPTPPSSPAP